MTAVSFLSNVFTDPSNPWYYVLGVLFLLLVFGALAVYVILSGKKKKSDANDPHSRDNAQIEPSNDTVTDRDLPNNAPEDNDQA